MSDFVVDTTEPNASLSRTPHFFRLLLAASLVGLAYYAGAKIGLALTFQPHPVSTLWPPNAILFATLLLTQTRRWWIFLVAAFPAHLLAQVNADIPTTLILCWYVSNCSEALISASLLRYLAGPEVNLNKTHSVALFIFALLVGGLLSSFLDAGFVMANSFGDSPYWTVFRMRFFSNTLASLTVVPVILTWARGELAPLRSISWRRYLEVGLLTLGLLIVGLISVSANVAGENTRLSLLYLPLPLLLWAAIRFGPRGASVALLIVSIFEIWGAIHGLGPFSSQSAELNALSVQLFLILASMPLMFLAALIKELEQAQELIRKLLGRAIDVQETERRRISRELHDDLNQKIATLSMSISWLKRKVPLADAELIAELEQLRQTTNGLTNEVRRLSHQLHPAVLEHLGLVTALESYVASFRDEEQIDVRLNADLGDERIPFPPSICLYRVAVEALRNVARHSGAKSAMVTLKRRHDVLELRVADSGKGFDVETFRQGGGLGLISVEERLRLLQGSCEIRSTPQRGTTLVARVPLGV